MKKIVCIFALLGLTLSTGCVSVKSTLAEDHHNHWLIRYTGIAPGIQGLSNAEVFYCPKDGARCVKAKVEK